MPVRIAVVQQEANPGHVQENRDKALGFAEEALRQGADAILFHEQLLTGEIDGFQAMAEPVDGPTTQAFQKLLRGSETLIIYGLTERDGEDYHISAPVVSAGGVIANYRKTHLWGSSMNRSWWEAEGFTYEPKHYRPGNRLVTFQVAGFKSGIMICYDGDFPETTRSYANLGCTMVFWMNNRGSRGHPEVRDLAVRNSMIVATSCCCKGNPPGRRSRGGSNITDAEGNLLAEIWDREGIIISDVFPEAVEEMRRRNPRFMGQRRDLYC
jgi:(R)-amidase